MLSKLTNFMFSPNLASGVGEFYALWITLFVVVNVIWDILTPRTEPFHFSHLSEKVDTLFSSTTFASSLYLMLTVFQQETTILTGSSKVPLIISAFSGVLISIRYLCPYDIPARKRQQVGVPATLPREPSIRLP